jgi:hypothetical protein
VFSRVAATQAASRADERLTIGWYPFCAGSRAALTLLRMNVPGADAQVRRVRPLALEQPTRSKLRHQLCEVLHDYSAR